MSDITKEIERLKAIYKKYGLRDQTDEFWLDLATENLSFIGTAPQSETTYKTWNQDNSLHNVGIKRDD